MNLLIKILLLLSLFGLGGCSSTSTVHVFAKYLNDDELNKVQTLLADSRYDVEVNRHEFPESVTSSTVIYSPMHSNPDEVTELLGLVAQSVGKKAELLYIRSENHSYTKDNVGLYLIGIDGRNSITVPTEVAFASPYSAVRCKSLAFAELVLKQDHQFELFTSAATDDDEKVTKGQWYRDKQNNRLELWLHGNIIGLFDINYTKDQLDVGLRKGIRLTPVTGEPDIDHCIFDYSIVF